MLQKQSADYQHETYNQVEINHEVTKYKTG